MNGRTGLERFHLLEGAAADDLASLDPLVQRKSYQVGEVIFQEGDAADAMYLVEQGSVEIVKMAGGTCLAVIGTGEEFGEMPFFDEGNRSAGARARESSVVVGLPFAALHTVLGQRTALAVVVYRNACKLMARRLRRTSSDYSWLSVYTFE